MLCRNSPQLEALGSNLWPFFGLVARDEATGRELILKTRLILIEGLPGAGKTSTTTYLGQNLQKQRVPCRWYLEEDPAHPIDCADMKLKNLDEKLPPLWGAFVERAAQEPRVTIIESRLWQNTALFMLMAEYPVEQIIRLHQRVYQVLSPLSPVLLYLYQADVESAQRRICEVRGEAWLAREMRSLRKYPWFQSRGLDGFDGWLGFFQEWDVVADRLYEGWPYRKTKIEDPPNDWDGAYQQMLRFLHPC
jgi:hypothetical protein